MSCDICGMFKPNNKSIGISQSDLPILEPKHTLAIDILQIEVPAECNILVCVDLYTSYITAIRVPGRLTSMSIAKTLLNAIVRYAPNCKVIRMDNAAYFKAAEFENFLTSLNIEPRFVTRLNSRANGKVERAIKSLNEQLRYLKMDSFTNQDWDLALETCTLMINLKPLHGNISPYTLVFGTIEPSNFLEFPKLPTDAISSYHKALNIRISAVRKILSLYFQSPARAADKKLLPKDMIVRIKVNQKRGYTKINAHKYSEDLFKIIDVREHTRSYKIQNLKIKNDIRYAHDRHVKPVINMKNNNEISKIIEKTNTLSRLQDNKAKAKMRNPRDSDIRNDNTLQLRQRSIKRS